MQLKQFRMKIGIRFKLFVSPNIRIKFDLYYLCAHKNTLKNYEI